MNERGAWTTCEEIATHEFDEVVAGIIARMWPVIKTTVDIGCGDGSYTKYLNENKIQCTGFDASPLTEEITGGLCTVRDFSEPQIIGMFDLVLCLEVGEHIPKEFEQIFIDNLCNAARKMIILSWAVPGQGGTGHVNCQTNDYVISEIDKRNFILYDGLTQRLRREARLSWFKETLMTFRWKGLQ